MFSQCNESIHSVVGRRVDSGGVHQLAVQRVEVGARTRQDAQECRVVIALGGDVEFLRGWRPGNKSLVDSEQMDGLIECRHGVVRGYTGWVVVEGRSLSTVNRALAISLQAASHKTFDEG